ncbi:MAG: hypothetical protein ACRC8K_13065 [Waterburya sp.]
MQIIQFQDSQQFYQRVENYLLNQEATHCLLLSFLAEDPHVPWRDECQ